MKENYYARKRQMTLWIDDYLRANKKRKKGFPIAEITLSALKQFGFGRKAVMEILNEYKAAGIILIIDDTIQVV